VLPNGFNRALNWSSTASLRRPKTGCLEHFSYHGHCHWFEMPIISQALNPPGESIDSQLPLEGAIRQVAPLPQQRHHLIHHRDKVHPVPSLLRCSAFMLMGSLIIA
jgi:hypothetical protein